MKFIDIKIEEYSINNSSPIPEYLLELEKETNLTKLMPQMLSGRLQGRLLSFLSKIIRPKNILEIGTFTGYSALCLAEGLKADGNLTTIEYDLEMEEIINKYFNKSPYNSQINLILDDAKNTLKTLKESYDLVFIDAFKEDYVLYYDMIVPMMNPGAIMIADNVLWSGKVIYEPQDKTAAAINKFNQHVKSDSRTENIILPIRDGLSLIRKI